MLGRSTPLRTALMCIGLPAMFVPAAEARAHRLIVECHVLPAGKVQVESWFDRGDSPKSAKVVVFRKGDEIFTQGRLDDNGIFMFSVENAEPLRVVVSVGDGHRAERTISEAGLAQSLAVDAATVNPNQRADAAIAPVPLSDRSSRISATDVLAGVGFLLAVAAFVMSWRNARRLGHRARA